ncbi:uncharacterized protein N7515_003557 [Penicillium bovifimosum]|uniref:Up-regulated during septation protein 1 domain-containing protein n=1 Tax=Penicillium bovifimosum TaxID=126998 RepID=A0A9W9H676_9EURO|nr:uncharacterized protein N7515_003557 [Penicillium bovifimosum]KAJ5138709.1 hypothetical protein N7515_003557 [Penicillium bovifimosum]
MNISMRSSQSSYGDPRYLSTMTVSDAPAPPHGKTLVDGYRDGLDPQHDDRSRYNPLNTTHPRSSAILNANDPVAMYLLTETAIGDSANYEVLSFEEVEELKKEATLLSTRIEGTKRKLALETKLRDAAQSIGRLYSPPSPRSSGEYGTNGQNPNRRSRIFGRSGISEALDKSDSELAVSQRRCEELAQELWKLEKRSQKINQRLLEHTAGVLQMTHKGLKKSPKNPAPHDSEDSHDKFDDRSLYRTTDDLNEFGVHGRIENNAAVAMNTEAMRATERQLEALSERMHDMMIRSNPGEFIDPPPQLSGGPVNPTATVEAYVAYIANGMNNIALRTEDSHARDASSVRAPEVIPEVEGAWKHQLAEINNRVQAIVDRFGLTRSPTLPPPPDVSHGEGLEEQLSYLQAGVDGLDSRVDGLLEQKSILTTQIQQQRELNSKSDAERDAHIGDLTEQLTHVRRDLEVSEREGNAHRDELALVMEQLNAMRHNGSSQEEAKAALVQAEGEVARLQSVVTSLHSEADARINEVSEARDAQDQAEGEVKRLQHYIEEVERENEARVVEISDARDRAEGEAKRLQLIIDSLQSGADAKSEEIREARDRAEEEAKRLQAVIVSMQHESDTRALEASEARDHAEEEVKRLQIAIEALQNDNNTRGEDIQEALGRSENEVQRLQGVIETLQNDSDSRLEEITGARDRAEQEVAQLEAAIQQIRLQSDTRVQEAEEQRAQSDQTATRLQNELTELEGEIVRVTTELTMVKAELDGAYGTRAERAAEVAADPSVQRENDALVTRNIELTEELAMLKSQRGGGDLQQRADTLEKELRETIDDYEAMTKASIEFEKERERFESFIDSLRDRCEQLETQLAEERISWMNLSSPTSVGRDGASETTSTMVLKNEFKKMMRDTRNENMKILRVSLS